MSGYFSTVVVLAAQVTLPVLGALLLARRRSPALATRTLFLATVAVLGLTIIAFVPRPNWVRAPQSVSIEMHADTGSQSLRASGGIDITELLRQVRPRVAPHSPGIEWERIVVLTMLLVAIVSLLRLSIAWARTLCLVRTARPITDESMQRMTDELRESLQIRRGVRVAEVEGVGPGAAFGWWRPTVLLSPSWRTWNESQRRAVLSHELAHIARRDLPVRLFARAMASIHGYHPCLRWLCHRLDLTQELAADRLAATQCGGRTVYLKCLASLALLADEQRAGALPAFLSRPRALFTRIAMLRVTEGARHNDRRWPITMAIGVLTAIALLLHGQSPTIQAGPVVRVKAEEEHRASPLDVSFILPSDDERDVGVAVVRFADLIAHKEIKAAAGEPLSDVLEGILPNVFGKGKKVHFKASDIEQIGGRVRITHEPTKPRPNRSLSISLVSVRSTKDFDWIAQMKEFCEGWKEHVHAGKKYYSGKVEGTLIPSIARAYFLQVDSRTVVLESETNIKELIDLAGKKATKPTGWEHVENGMAAIAYQSPKKRLAHVFQTDGEESSSGLDAALLKAVGTSMKGADAAVMGLLPGKSTVARMHVYYESSSANDEAAKSLASIGQMLEKIKLGDVAPRVSSKNETGTTHTMTCEWSMPFTQFLAAIPWE